MPPVEQSRAVAEAPTVPRLRPAMPCVPFARSPVLSIASVVAAVLLVLSQRYGYLSDELYFLAAGKHYLDWGYMDQQPLVPLLAAGLDAVAPGSLFVLRLPAVLVTVLGIVITALIAREFGGDRRAQTLAAAAYPLSPWLLLSGHWLTAATLEPLQWATIIWLVVRWVRLHHAGTDRDRLLLLAGVVTGATLQTKFQVLVLCAALLVASITVGPRALPRRPALWAGAAIALIMTVPTLLWQATHSWPALEMGAVVNDESDRLLLLPVALGYAGLIGAVLCCYGYWHLVRSPILRPYRFVGWALLGVAVFYLLTGGRANYFASLYGPLFAAAAVGLQRRRISAERPRRVWVVWPVYLLSALLPIAFLPIYPLSMLARYPELPNASRVYETGWPELAGTVSRAYHSLPAETRRRTAIVGETYHIASALDIHGRAFGLPRSYSPHRGYWFFGQPPQRADVVLYVGTAPALDPYFDSRRRLDTVDNEGHLVNLAQGVQVFRYDRPAQPWSLLWSAMRTR